MSERYIHNQCVVSGVHLLACCSYHGDKSYVIPIHMHGNI